MEDDVGALKGPADGRLIAVISFNALASGKSALKRRAAAETGDVMPGLQKEAAQIDTEEPSTAEDSESTHCPSPERRPAPECLAGCDAIAEICLSISIGYRDRRTGDRTARCHSPSRMNVWSPDSRLYDPGRGQSMARRTVPAPNQQRLRDDGVVWLTCALECFRAPSSDPDWRPLARWLKRLH